MVFLTRTWGKEIYPASETPGEGGNWEGTLYDMVKGLDLIVKSAGTY